MSIDTLCPSSGERDCRVSSLLYEILARSKA